MARAGDFLPSGLQVISIDSEAVTIRDSLAQTKRYPPVRWTPTERPTAGPQEGSTGAAAAAAAAPPPAGPEAPQ